MMRVRCLLMLFCLLVGVRPLAAQTFMESGTQYPVTADGNKYAVSGFVRFDNLSDEKIYANAMLWVIEHLCPQLREGITEVSVSDKKFGCEFTLASLPDASQEATYYVKAMFRVVDGKLIYYLSDILIESAVLMMKKVTPLEKLSPEKKAAHKQSMDAFVRSESVMLNTLFDFVATNRPTAITHWNEIGLRRPVEGMTEDECRLAFGKPQAVMESNGEVQWMYSTSFYLFFRNGRVETIVR